MKRRNFGKDEKSLLRSREMIAWGQLVLAVALVMLTISSCSDSFALQNLSNQQLTTVQLCDGQTLYAQKRFSKEREDAVIQDFAQKWVSLTWSWDGFSPGTKHKDPGVKAANGSPVPMTAWAASYMMNSDFAVGFLNELSEKIPQGVFNGQYSATVNFRYVSAPRQIKPGIWDVDLISERIIFDEYNRQQLKPIPFNKTLRLSAVPIAYSPLKDNANALTKTLYSMKAQGLEIQTLLDYKP